MNRSPSTCGPWMPAAYAEGQLLTRDPRGSRVRSDSPRIPHGKVTKCQSIRKRPCQGGTGTKAAQAMATGVRATRATSWLAGRMHVGRGTIPRAARNGAAWRTHANGKFHWRGPVKKGKGYTSNLEVYQSGHHLHRDLHIIHRKPSRWMPWR